MELPLGFNTISSVYLPLIPAPSLSSLLLTTQPLYQVKDFLYNSAEVELPSTTLDSNKSWVISLDYLFDYTVVNNTTRFPIVNFYCQVFDINGNIAPAGVGLVLKLIDTDFKLINIPLSINSVTNDKGIANFNLQLNFLTVSDTVLRFIVYPSSTPDQSNIIVNNLDSTSYEPSSFKKKQIDDTLNELPFKSNKVTIKTFNGNSLNKKSNSINERNLLNDSITLQNNIITENVNQIYNDLFSLTSSTNEYVSPYEACATSSIEAGSRLIQGFTKNEICRYSGWGTKVLFDVHSHLSANSNSEINLIDRVVTLNESNANFLESTSVTLNRYKDILEITGQHVTATASTYLSTQSNQGNNLTTANIDQTHAQHIRLNAGANIDLHAGGKVSFVANQLFINAKWINIASDTFQQISQHFWLRSEELLNIAGKETIRYNHGSLQEYSANSLIASGQTIQYSDVLWNQIGQVNSPPLHPSRTKPLDYRYDGINQTPYGTAINLSMQDYHIVSKFGHIRLRSPQHMKFLSDMGGFHFKALSNTFLVDTKSVKVNALKNITIKSSSKITLNGQMVCINCNNIADDFIDGDIDNAPVISQVAILAPASDIVGKKINSAGQVLNNNKQIIAVTTAPYLSSSGEVIHSVVDKYGNLVGFSSSSALNNKAFVAPLRDQPSIPQGQAAKREKLVALDYENYTPMTFSRMSDPASTIKTTGGSTTGPVIQVGSKLPNPSSTPLAGPPGSGAAN